MTKNGTTEFSSPFDDMLAENRREFDNLYGGPAPKPAAAAAPARPAAASSSTPSRPAAPPKPGAAAQGSVDGIAFGFRP